MIELKRAVIRQPAAGYATYMIYSCWQLQKTEREKLFMVPNTVRGRPGGSLQSRASRGPVRLCRLFAAPSRCAGVPDRLMVNYYIQYTSMVPSKVMTRCKLGVRPPSRVGRESVERGAVSAKPTHSHTVRTPPHAYARVRHVIRFMGFTAFKTKL